MRRRWALLASLVALSLLGSLVAKASSRTTLLRQTNESDGHREPEYGLFGVTLIQPQIDVPGLKVSDDFRAELSKTGLKSPALVQEQYGQVSRTIRPGGTQYWLRLKLSTSREQLAAFYAAQLSDVHRGGQSSETITGLCPDGKTRIRLLVAPMAEGNVDFLLTFGPGS